MMRSLSCYQSKLDMINISKKEMIQFLNFEDQQNQKPLSIRQMEQMSKKKEEGFVPWQRERNKTGHLLSSQSESIHHQNKSKLVRSETEHKSQLSQADFQVRMKHKHNFLEMNMDLSQKKEKAKQKVLLFNPLKFRAMPTDRLEQDINTIAKVNERKFLQRFTQEIQLKQLQILQSFKNKNSQLPTRKPQIRQQNTQRQTISKRVEPIDHQQFPCKLQNFKFIDEINVSFRHAQDYSNHLKRKLRNVLEIDQDI